ncbi:MAG TPA: 2-oxo acid dehydrogenase subunit E2 [Pirellulaceae bacterium]|nr:2-oxo acid dehydrogenase subunit E2 [Pirellulaceae bacterium]
MPTEVKLPNLGDGIDTGDVLELLVKEGDTIAKDQGIVELETGKATLQVPSSAAGKILKVHIKPGQTIPVGATLLTLEGATADVAQAPPKTAPKPAKAPPPKPAPALPPAAEAPSPPRPAAAPTPVPPAPPAPASVQAPAPAPSPSPSPLPEPTTDGHVAAGPAVRRFAREVGVDLARVTGSGPGGRITREDVLTVVRQASQTAAAAPTAKGKGSTATARDNWGPIRVEKMTKIRKVIAAKMHESWMTCPRVVNFDDADVTDLEKIRASSKDDYAKKGIKLTSLPFVIKAVASALRNHPLLNASVDLEQGQIVFKEYVNIGIAVDTERGLVVPSLRSADELSIADTARALAALAERVRDGSFNMADLQGSTFTISNLGAVGGTYSTPIINTPEVAILLVGRSRQLPVVVDDQIAVRLMMPLSLAYDHRLVDGATAARFLNEVIDYLEAPSRLLLAP